MRRDVSPLPRLILLAAFAAFGVVPASLTAQVEQSPASLRLQAVGSLIRSRFSGERAMETVAFVERFWRVPGNTGFNESIKHIAEQLEAAGYVAEERARSGDRLVYRVERRSMDRPTWEPADAAVTIVGQPAPLLRFATNRNMLAINSRSTPAGGAEADLVDAGAGRPEDFEGKDVRGRIVMADASVGQLFREAVQNRGALGVLAYNMPAYTRPQVNRTSIQFSSVPLDTTRAGWGILLSYAAREALRRALAAGPVRVKVEVQARSYRSEELTVIATARGHEAPKEQFVFSAHVQEPGANDNASGVGAEVEMARTLAELVRSDSLVLNRSVVFLWGDEIRGTQRYLQTAASRGESVRWGLSLDMVGENTALTGGTFLIEKMPDPAAVWTRGDEHHTEWGGGPVPLSSLRPHYFNDFALSRALDQARETGWVVRTNPFEGGSDHTPFLDAGKPGLLFWHFTDQFYHTDNDRLDKVSADELTNCGVTALWIGVALAGGGQPLADLVVDETEQRGLARLAAEFELSRKSLAAGGELGTESQILRAWTDWYAGAIRATEDIEVGGAIGRDQTPDREWRSGGHRGGGELPGPVAVGYQLPAISHQVLASGSCPPLNRSIHRSLNAGTRIPRPWSRPSGLRII